MQISGKLKSIISFDLKLKCLRCIAKTKELALPFRHFWRGVYVLIYKSIFHDYLITEKTWPPSANQLPVDIWKVSFSLNYCYKTWMVGLGRGPLLSNAISLNLATGGRCLCSQHLEFESYSRFSVTKLCWTEFWWRYIILLICHHYANWIFSYHLTWPPLTNQISAGISHRPHWTSNHTSW